MSLLDMGFDEWLSKYHELCELYGVEPLVGGNRELERLFDAGRTPEETVETLHLS